MYQFTDDCLIGITQIDEEHRALFGMLNEAFTLLGDSVNIPLIARNLIPKLREYAATHFAHEEAYMEETHDPELPMQRREHAEFTAKMNSLDIGGEFSKEEMESLLTYLVRWLYRHILSSDMMIGKLPAREEKQEKEGADPFAFTERFHTGIELIDSEHARLFEIIREVADVIDSQTLYDKYDEIIRLLEELKDYTEFHFRDEEEYMTSIAYPGLDGQKRAHAVFVDKLVNINLEELEEIDEHQDEYLTGLIDFLLGWLTEHILKVDKLVGKFVEENKVK